MDPGMDPGAPVAPGLGVVVAALVPGVPGPDGAPPEEPVGVAAGGLSDEQAPSDAAARAARTMPTTIGWPRAARPRRLAG